MKHLRDGCRRHMLAATHLITEQLFEACSLPANAGSLGWLLGALGPRGLAWVAGVWAFWARVFPGFLMALAHWAA